MYKPKYFMERKTGFHVHVHVEKLNRAAPLKHFENRCEFFMVAEHLAVQVLRDTIEGVWFVLGSVQGPRLETLVCCGLCKGKAQ